MACGHCRRRRNPAFGAAKYTKEQADGLLRQGLISPERHAELTATASGGKDYSVMAGAAVAILGGLVVGSIFGGKR